METNLNKIIGAAIRKKRIACNLTQEKVAEKLDISFQQVQKYEKGENRVSSENLAMISMILGCPVTDLLEDVFKVLNGDEVIIETKRRSNSSTTIYWDDVPETIRQPLKTILKYFQLKWKMPV